MECRQRSERQGNPDGSDQLIRSAEGCSIPGEVGRDFHLAFAADRREYQGSPECEQGRRSVADGGSGAEVSADRCAVSDKFRGELRQQFCQEGNPTVQHPFDLGEGQASPDLNKLISDLEGAELRNPVDCDDERGTTTPQVDLDSPVCRAGNEHGRRILGHQRKSWRE